MDSQRAEHIEYLDGWRGLAILFVLVGHFFPVTNYIYLGRFGVDVFFVLSGFLMTRILFEFQTPLKRFYKRRISRILPVFAVYVSLIYSIDYFYLHTGEFENYFYTLSFLRTYLPGTDIWAAPIPIDHLWSLNVEEHSYVILSMLTLFLFAKRNIGLVLLFISVCGVGLHLYYWKSGLGAEININARTETAAVPLFAAAGYYWLVKEKRIKVSSWMPLLSFFLAMLFYSKWSPHWTFSWLISPFLLAFSVNHLRDTSEGVKRLLSNKTLTNFGVLSYSIYLWQQPLYKAIKSESFADINILILGVFLFLVAYILGYFSYRMIEEPSRKFLNERW